MARSKDKKRRIKMEQIGKRNPECSRVGWNGVKPVTKRTPTLTEKLNKVNKKWSVSDDEHSTSYLKRSII